MKKLGLMTLTALLISATSHAGPNDLEAHSGAPHTPCVGVCDKNKVGGTTLDHQKKQHCELNVDCSPGANGQKGTGATGTDDANESK